MPEDGFQPPRQKFRMNGLLTHSHQKPALLQIRQTASQSVALKISLE